MMWVAVVLVWTLYALTVVSCTDLGWKIPVVRNFLRVAVMVENGAIKL